MPYTIENGYTIFQLHRRAVARLLEVGWLTMNNHVFGREASEKNFHTLRGLVASIKHTHDDGVQREINE